MLKVPNNLYVKWTDEKGYAVFSDEPIKKGDVIETCYLIKTGSPHIHGVGRFLMEYVFQYPKDSSAEVGEHVLALGFGGIYNHSDDNNAKWEHTPDMPYHFDFIAVKDIAPHEEICTFYGKEYLERIKRSWGWNLEHLKPKNEE